MEKECKPDSDESMRHPVQVSSEDTKGSTEETNVTEDIEITEASGGSGNNLAQPEADQHQDTRGSTEKTNVTNDIEITEASGGSGKNLAQPEPDEHQGKPSPEWLQTVNDDKKNVPKKSGSVEIKGGCGVVAAGGQITGSDIRINIRESSNNAGKVRNIVGNRTCFGGGQKITHFGDVRQNVSKSSNFVVGISINTDQIVSAGQGSSRPLVSGDRVTNIFGDTTTFQGDQVKEHHGDVVQNISHSSDFAAASEIRTESITFEGSRMKEQATSSEKKTVLSHLNVDQVVELLQEKKFHEETIAQIKERKIDGNALEYIIESDSALTAIAYDEVDKSKLKSIIKEKL